MPKAEKARGYREQGGSARAPPRSGQNRTPEGIGQKSLGTRLVTAGGGSRVRGGAAARAGLGAGRGGAPSRLAGCGGRGRGVHSGGGAGCGAGRRRSGERGAAAIGARRGARARVRGRGPRKAPDLRAWSGAGRAPATMVILAWFLTPCSLEEERERASERASAKHWVF